MPVAELSIPPSTRRILVYGVTGSGKSVAARRIAERLDLPCHLADELTWEPGWTPVDPDEQQRRFAAIAAQESWVLDTAYSGWLDVVLPRVQLIVGLDYPRWFSLLRLMRRTAARIHDKQRVCNGNVETVRATLGANSILRWHFRSFHRKRSRMHSWHAVQHGPPILLFCRSAALDDWIASLAPAVNDRQ